MADKEYQQQLFTKHLFRSACTCPTKLYYKADPATYPEQQQQLPFIEHIRYNKRQLRLLLERLFPAATPIQRQNYHRAAEKTTRLLDEEYTVIFHASFICDHMFARLPVVEKDGGRVRIYDLQTKAFDPGRHSMTGHHGNIHSKWKNYLIDLAFKLFVIKHNYPAWKLEPYLVLPDRTATTSIDNLDKKLAAGTEINRDEVSKLLAFVPVMKEIEAIWEGKEPLFDEENEPFGMNKLPFETVLYQFLEWYLKEEKVFADIGKKCATCEYRVQPDNLKENQRSGYQECWGKILEGQKNGGHIFNLIGAGNGQLIKDRVFLQHQVPLKNKVSPRQIAESEGRITDHHRRVLQVTKAKGEPVPHEIIKPQLLKELKQWEYPLHFLDFEAGSFAVPIRAGRNPYHQVVFQYSCHTLYPDGSLEHNQWVHTGDDTYANFKLISELKKIPEFTNGTIIHYSGFERSALRRVLSELKQDSDQVPNSSELIAWLEGIVLGGSGNTPKKPLMADMGRLVKNYYYNAEMEDSLSIKDILITVMKISPLLRKRFSKPYNSSNFEDVIWWQQEREELKSPYEILLEERGKAIGQGTEAMVAYGRLRTELDNESEREKLVDGLLSYCELDTLAMVMIYLHWETHLIDRHLN